MPGCRLDLHPLGLFVKAHHGKVRDHLLVSDHRRFKISIAVELRPAQKDMVDHPALSHPAHRL
jgi:hypothetical protein